MALTVNAKTYNGNQWRENSITFTGPAHTAIVKDDITLRFTSAKPTPVFSGVTRVGLKLVRTSTLSGALTPKGDVIFDISVSIPIGTPSADLQAINDDLAAWLATANADNWLINATLNP